MSRKEREKEFKKNLIGDAAEKLFLNNSFETVTMEDIAKEAEFGKGTLYQYFESKEDILVFVLCRSIADVSMKIEEQIVGEIDVKKSIENLIEIYYLFLKEYMNLFISFVKRQLDGNIPEH